MLVSDYNRLRKILGFPPVTLQKGEYAIHCKKRILVPFKKFAKEQGIELNGEALRFNGIYTEGISQDGRRI